MLRNHFYLLDAMNICQFHIHIVRISILWKNNLHDRAVGRSSIMTTLEKALLIAVQAHSSQKDRYGQPYILHPLRVMMRVKPEVEKIVAVLHDVVEDSELTLEDLKREGFSDEIVRAVDCLTKREGEPYEAHVERARQNLLALPVKIADLEDNMDPQRMGVLSDEDKKRVARYHKTWASLKMG